MTIGKIKAGTVNSVKGQEIVFFCKRAKSVKDFAEIILSF